jgi:hypothetical protein
LSLNFEGDGDAKIGNSADDVIQITGSLKVDGGAVFNEGSADKDFRIESNHAETHMFYIDGGNNRIGMGTTSKSPNLFDIDLSRYRTGHEKDACTSARWAVNWRCWNQVSCRQR